MAKNKATRTENLTGFLDIGEDYMRIETEDGDIFDVYKDLLQSFNGEEVAITAKVDKEIEPSNE